MPQDNTSRRSSWYPPDNRSRRASRGQASADASRFAPTSTRTGDYYDSAPQYPSQPTTGVRPRMVAQTTGHTPSYPPMSSYAPPSSAYLVRPSGNVASSQDKYRRVGGIYTPTPQYMPLRYSDQATSGLGGPDSYAPQAIRTQAYEPAVRMPGSQPITVPSRIAGETPGRSQDSRGFSRPPTPGALRRQDRRSLTPGAPLASRGGVDTRGTTTPTGSYGRRRSEPIDESGSNKSRSKLVIRNGAGTLTTLYPGDTYESAAGKTLPAERDERATGTQLPPPPTPPLATATSASAATQRPPSAVRPRTPLQSAQSEFSSNDKVVEVGSLSPKSSGGNSMQTGGLATIDKDFADRRPRSRSRNNTRATHDASYMATRRSGDALTRDPPGSSYPSHPEAKYSDAPPRGRQRSSNNSKQAEYDEAPPRRIPGRERTQDLPPLNSKLMKNMTNMKTGGRDILEPDMTRAPSE
ncbi:hypothetical protein L202_02847 [Cryptococcus amylolentus CBS 6039]|uniref:Uncharacterized protein n=1 Tax=Cryptococcus amylolentus CBS 6039 TaxID=1295533 RepID=A0A1E3HWI3_9TREE|nr:hypothetical protein L202_02847 [Cryptococcus amylolentus CBS 6039]ODN80670.1 hypothetical protein L202_02847 [Cryptococcus amylolentus CBS 6039]